MASLFFPLVLFACVVLPARIAHAEDIDPGLVEGLKNWGLTSYLEILQRGFPPGTENLPPCFFNSSMNTTFFVPNNNAFNPELARGTTFENGFDGIANDTIVEFFKYHSSPLKLDLNSIEPGPAHLIVPTWLTNYELSHLDDNRTEELVLTIGRDSSGVPHSTILNQRVTVNIIEGPITSGNPGYNIYVIDQVMELPLPYYVVQGEGAWPAFDALQKAAKVDLDGTNGFTIFAPTGDNNLTSDAKKKFPNSTDFMTFFNNHLMYDHAVFSPEFTNGTHTSGSGFNYTFGSNGAGGYTVTLNNITANISFSDIITANGVVHLIDQPLWKLEPLPPTSSAPPSGSTGAPSPTQSGQSSSKHGLSGGAIAGIVVGPIAFIIIVVAGILWHRRRQPSLDYYDEKRLTPTYPSIESTPYEATPFVLPGPSGDGGAARSTLPRVLREKQGRALRHDTPEIPTGSQSAPSSLPPAYDEGAGPSTTAAHVVSPVSPALATAPEASPASAAAPTRPLTVGQALQASDLELPLSDEVVERLLRTLAQRIDPPSGRPESTSPPQYPNV
ncbi:hypothetical protein PsYK624_068610 [Phanerochaete sordida]|uniref:FAS1 domain-containing protein n=1 Tax=Phanerochaete sordida TaxID=48140 RepID=A0A9P3LE85_9APHY|nr:hypothetical protein PsYK624_068610 [Phanerochaete sordida]